MAWETRGSQRYYYRKERTDDGRVRSVYVGTGRVADLVAQLDDLEAERLALERSRLRLSLEPIDDALAMLRDSERRLRTLRDAYLVATGHRSHRGQWRRRRGFTAAPFLLTDRPPRAHDMAAKKNTPYPVEPSADGESIGIQTSLGTAFFAFPETVSAEDRLALTKAIEAINVDDPTGEDVSKLRDALVRLPAGHVDPMGSRVARRRVSVAINGGVLGYVSSHLEAEAERFKKDLTTDEDGPLVHAAADQAATARLVLDAVTSRYGNAFQGKYSFAEMDHLERRMNSAQTRYVRALATVAALRKAEGVERERAAQLAPDQTPKRTMDLHSFLPPAEAARNRVKRKVEAIAATQSGDSLPAPSDLDLAVS